MSDDQKSLRQPIDQEWSKWITSAAMQIQKMAKPANQLVQQIGRFANSAEGQQLMEVARKIMEAKERAEQLSNAMHEAQEISDVQKLIDSMDIDAYTLMTLILLERDKEASEVEQKLASAAKTANIEKAKIAAAARLANDKNGKQKAKREAYGFWKRSVETGPAYKGPAEFARVMLDKFDVLENQKTVEDWFREWPQGKNLPVDL